MPRYAFRIEYDGTGYAGWQVQNDARTIQGELERVWRTLLPSAGRITGAGRTDAGVHALAQAAHVDTEEPVRDIRACVKSLNALLGPDIAVRSLVEVPSSFHARYSATARSYAYRFSLRKQPLRRHRLWRPHPGIDWECMATHISALEGMHDFGAFCAAGGSTRTNLCTVSRVALTRTNDMYIFSITANRFLYKMVRTIVGTLVDIARGKCSAALEDILESKDRTKAGPTAPAKGLTLTHVEYPDEYPV
jgi:tRNA pseudouridine38-40 synthase